MTHPRTRRHHRAPTASSSRNAPPRNAALIRATEERRSTVMLAYAGEQHHELPFIRKYIFSTDHKIIGIQFLFMSLLFLLIGGLLAGIMRWQLGYPQDALPGGSILPATMAPDGIILPEFYNAAVTMHGTIMVFFAIMPLLVGVYANYLI